MSAGSVWLGRGGDGGRGNSWTRRRSKLVEIAIDGQWSEVKKASLSRPPGLDRPLTACVRFLNGKVFDFRRPLVSQLNARLAPLMRTLKPRS